VARVGREERGVIDIAAERKAHQEREEVRRVERMAASCLWKLGHSATRAALEEMAQERWKLTPAQATAVGNEAERLKSEGAERPRHLPPSAIQEEETLMQIKTERIKEVTRAVLLANPKIKCKDAYETVITRRFANLKLSSFEVTYFYAIRKELREAGEIPTPAKKATPVGEDKKKGDEGKRRPIRKRPERYTPPEPVEIPEPVLELKSPEEIRKEQGGVDDPGTQEDRTMLMMEPAANRALEPMSETEIRLLQRLAEIEIEGREIEAALTVISRLHAA